MLLGDCSPRYFIVYKILSPIKLVTFKIQDAKIYHSNRLTVLFTVTPIKPSLIILKDAGTVTPIKPSLIILKDAGIFNMRALQIDFHAIPLVHTFLSHCLFKFSFHV